MPSRDPINSSVLQKRFPAIYRDFFSRCQKVASASNSFLWTGEFAGFYDGLIVSQKLPISSYVGFEATDNGKVEVNRQYQNFQATEQSFVTGVIDERLATNLESYISQQFQNQPNFEGLRVHLLTEVPLGHSLGSFGAVAAATALLLAPTKSRESAKASDREQIYEAARQILTLSQAGYSSGVTAYMALVDSNEPVVFFRQNEEYFAKPLSQLADLTAGLVWPIDFGLIYSGGITNSESVILANDQTIAELDSAAARLGGLLTGWSQQNFKQTYLGMLNMTSSLMIIAFVDLFISGSSKDRLRQFFNTLNQYQNHLRILHVSNGATDLIYRQIHHLANEQQNEVGSGVKISGIGRGGCVLFAVPYGNHRQGVIDLVEDLRRQSGKDIWLDYASWLDGIGGRPGQIEQDLESGRHSPLLGGDILLMRVIKQGRPRQVIMTSEQLELASKEFDLILDKTSGKITIAGRTLTSKELPTQKATVTILADLLQDSKQLLNNDKLPGSYGENRYDLQGKIVSPLIKQVKKITGRDLQLSVSGGMYADYAIKINPSNVLIGVIEQKR